MAVEAVPVPYPAVAEGVAERVKVVVVAVARGQTRKVVNPERACLHSKNPMAAVSVTSHSPRMDLGARTPEGTEATPMVPDLPAGLARAVPEVIREQRSRAGSKALAGTISPKIRWLETVARARIAV
jgi:hypothetical protein